MATAPRLSHAPKRRSRGQLHWSYRFVALALTVEIVLSLGAHGAGAGAFIAGDHGWQNAFDVSSLAAAVVLAAAFVLASNRLRGSAEEKRLLEGLLGGAYAASPDWYWRTDADLVFTYCSQGVRELLNYNPEELIGQHVTDVVVESDSDGMTIGLLQAVREGRGWHGDEAQWRRRDGRVVNLIGSAMPVFEPAGALTGFTGVQRLPEHSRADVDRLEHIRLRTLAVIDQRRIAVAAQPIISVRDVDCVGVEALCRFIDNEGPPDRWFAEAHDAGLGVELELAAVAAILASAAHLPEDAYISINASPEVLCDARMSDMLLGSDVDLGRLVLEITEHTAITSYSDVVAHLTPLRDRGIRVAVDDAGAGYASLQHVMQLRPDIIKLDRSLIQDLGQDRARRVLITSMVLLALELGATVTAEGVERAEEFEHLDTLGVDAVQGYFFARPTSDRDEWAKWTPRSSASAGWPTVR